MTYKGIIKFDDREWLVIDTVEYEGVKYFYIIENISEELNKVKSLEEYDGDFHLEFIYKLDNGNYKNVTDYGIIQNLLTIVGAKNIFTDEEFA